MFKATIIGNVTADLEVRKTKGEGEDRTVCEFVVAVNTGKNDHTEFVRVVVWGNIAENHAKYLRKGSSVAVIGDVEVECYLDKEGKPAAYAKIVRVDEVKYLDKKAKE